MFKAFAGTAPRDTIVPTRLCRDWYIRVRIEALSKIGSLSFSTLRYLSQRLQAQEREAGKVEWPVGFATFEQIFQTDLQTFDSTSQ